MDNIAFYRRLSDGAHHTKAEVIFLAKPNGSRHQVFLPQDASRWDAYALGMLGYVPVAASEPPAVNLRHNSVNGNDSDLVDGQYVQVWTVKPRYASLTELRERVIEHVEQLLEEKRDSGTVVLGVPVKTDGAGIARLQASVRGGKPNRKFIAGGKVHRLNKAQIVAIADAVDDFQQGLYDRAADLIDQINASDTPDQVDINSGW